MPRQPARPGDETALGQAVRTLTTMTSASWTPMHPAWLRCSSHAYSRYAHASRLASRAPRRSRCRAYCGQGPSEASPQTAREARAVIGCPSLSRRRTSVLQFGLPGRAPLTAAGRGHATRSTRRRNAPAASEHSAIGRSLTLRPRRSRSRRLSRADANRRARRAAPPAPAGPRRQRGVASSRPTRQWFTRLAGSLVGRPRDAQGDDIFQGHRQSGGEPRRGPRQIPGRPA
jgi:hypothetical protein